MPRKTPKNPVLKLPAGYAWRNPEDIILEGDEVLIWNREEGAPCWFKAVNMIGTTPQQSEVLVRCKLIKAKKADASDAPDAAQLPE